MRDVILFEKELQESSVCCLLHLVLDSVEMATSVSPALTSCAERANDNEHRGHGGGLGLRLQMALGKRCVVQ